MIVIVTGPTVSGPALMLGLADIVIMVDGAYAFVSGPAMVEQFTGVPVDTDELGGAAVHGRTSGVATMIAADLDEAEALARDLLAHLPDHTDEAAPGHPCLDPVGRPTPEAYDVLPESTNGSYDCRDILRSIVDDGDLLELHAGWAGNLVTCFAAIGGRSIGIVANQPQTIAGTLDITASRKGARFVAMCDAFNLPLLTLVDTVDASFRRDWDVAVDSYRSLDRMTGRTCAFQTPSGPVEGRVRRLDPLRGIEVETEFGVQFLPAATTSVVPPPGPGRYGGVDAQA